MIRARSYSDLILPPYTHVPEATFYLMVKAPIEDDVAFTEALAKHDVFVLPGDAGLLPDLVHRQRRDD